LAIKIETVKPMPAALPVATKSNLPFCFGLSATFNFVKILVKLKIPRGLPITRAANIAIAIGDVAASLIDSIEISTPVLARPRS
jgi:hypothetical protein